MLVYALDGNQQILLLAWALVSYKNQDNQEYFLNHLKEAYLPYSEKGFVLISDQDKELVSATEKVLVKISHAKCCYHIKENIVSSSFFLKKNYLNSELNSLNFSNFSKLFKFKIK